MSRPGDPAGGTDDFRLTEWSKRFGCFESIKPQAFKQSKSSAALILSYAGSNQRALFTLECSNLRASKKQVFTETLSAGRLLQEFSNFFLNVAVAQQGLAGENSLRTAISKALHIS